MKQVALFPGQGSQYVGMGLDLFNNFDKAKAMYKLADSILGFSISDISFNGPLETLKETRYTQPALFVHSAILFELIKDKIQIAATAGHSVGEYAALFATGVITFEDGLKIVAKRGDLMFQSGVEQPGTMYAVIGLEDEKVEDVCRQCTANGNGQVVVAANYNSPGQLVISGSKELLTNSVSKFKEAGAKMVKELVVSGAFHSPLMQSSADELSKIINTTDFQNAKVPVYLNVTSKPETDANIIKQALIEQLTSPVLWSQSMQNMRKDELKTFIEVGAGSVLQGLAKRSISDAVISGVDKIESLQQFV